MIQLNEEEETPRDKQPETPGLAALRRRLSLNVSSSVAKGQTSGTTLDLAELYTLDSQIKAGESTDEIEEKFRPMAEKFA